MILEADVVINFFERGIVPVEESWESLMRNKTLLDMEYEERQEARRKREGD